MTKAPTGLRYLRIRWRESPGPDQDWGHSTWLMSVRADGTVVEQFEIYDSGLSLNYDAKHPADDLGSLSEPLDQQAIDTAFREFDGEWIDADSYRAATSTLRPTNR